MFSPYEDRHCRGPRRICPQGEAAQKLAAEGHEVVDFGTGIGGILRLPGFRASGGRDVAQGRCDRGILVCSTGSAWRSRRTKWRACAPRPRTNDDEVRLTREHNDANVLTLGAKYLDASTRRSNWSTSS